MVFAVDLWEAEISDKSFWLEIYHNSKEHIKRREDVYSFPNMESQNHKMCTWRRRWSTKSEGLTRSVQQGLWPWNSLCVRHPAPYSRAVGRWAWEGMALAQHPELLVFKAKTQAQAQALPQVCTSWVYPGSLEHSVRMEAVMVHGAPSIWVCPVAVLGLQSLDTYGGALTPLQELHATLLLTHCLVGERVEGLKLRKLVTWHSLRWKHSLRRKAKVTHAKLATPTFTSTATTAAVGSSSCVLPSPTSYWGWQPPQGEKPSALQDSGCHCTAMPCGGVGV